MPPLPRGSEGTSASRPVLVLVHGAWHGGWCWARVLTALRAANVDAMAPTLTGLGERAHLISPAVDLETHVRDIAAVIESEELEGVVLVGHSYAGALLGGVAERAGGRVRRLVYVDGLVPERGDSVLALFPTEVADAIAIAARNAGGWRVPPWPASSFGVTDPADREWVDRRLTDHPFATLTQAGALPPPAGMPRSFVACTVRQRDTYVRFAETARVDASWDYFELPTGHDAMVTAPGPLAEVLVQAAAGDQG
jgi:pimeloyl-ACP methyl ester carboxylesterase